MALSAKKSTASLESSLGVIVVKIGKLDDIRRLASLFSLGGWVSHHRGAV
jgi:hypothetical protein